jgi:hypothetical protein
MVLTLLVNDLRIPSIGVLNGADFHRASHQAPPDDGNHPASLEKRITDDLIGGFGIQMFAPLAKKKSTTAEIISLHRPRQGRQGKNIK